MSFNGKQHTRNESLFSIADVIYGMSSVYVYNSLISLRSDMQNVQDLKNVPSASLRIRFDSAAVV